jgi:hypothetical protein
LRCDEAFKEFAATAEFMIRHGENRRLAYKAYNAYARFVHHLYEFALGAVARDRNDTEPLKHEKHKPYEMAERYITGIVQRILTNKREAILQGTAPVWENHISAYPEQVPLEFAKEFRLLRNTASGHVKHQRASLNLSDFYEKYHMYLYMLYANCIHMWGTIGDDFPDLGEITAFSVLLKKQPQPASAGTDA